MSADKGSSAARDWRWRWPPIRASSSRPCRSASPWSGSSPAPIRARALAARRASGWRRLGCRRTSPDEAGFALVIAATTYFSLVVGELVPKQLALRAAEPIALIAARPMALLAKAMAPFVWLLDRSSSLLLRLIGVRRSGERSADRRRAAHDLRRGNAFGRDRGGRAGDHDRHHAPRRAAGARADDPAHRARLDRPRRERGRAPRQIAQAPHSLLPVADGSPDNIVGVVKVARRWPRCSPAGRPLSPC